VKVKLGSKELLTTQMYVAGDPSNNRDFLTRMLRSEERSMLEVPFQRGSDGWQAQFGIVVSA
jgi:protocatechuate 3,4-dioxygenase beta subunit